MNPELLAAINRKCEASVTYGLPAQEIVSTGLPQLDAALGGGIPRGRIVEIHGREDSGKTTLALHLAAQLPGPTLYVDADHGLSPYMLRGTGELYRLDVGTLEDTLDACSLAAGSGAFGSIVIDTVAALPTNEDMQTSLNDGYCGNRERQARVMSKALPILATALHHSGCTLILVNQMRIKPGVLYGNPEHPTGGKAISYYAALRLCTGTVEPIKTNGWNPEHIGKRIRVRVTKNKLAPPGKEAETRLIYGKGLSA